MNYACSTHVEDANIKSRKAGKRLNPFNSLNDKRFDFLRSLARMFKEMDTYSASSHTRVMGLTTNTSSALHITLNGICNVLQTLLRRGMKYVLTGHLQSDRIEAEFGIYRQQSGGNYNISVQQVVNSQGLQRLKLFNKLDLEQSHVHIACCRRQKLTPEEVECLDSRFESTSSITVVERLSLFHIAGYVAYKEKSSSSTLDKTAIALKVDSEFARMVSRGKLSYPSECL